MKVVTTQDAPILIPNEDHKNFTMNGVVIPRGVELEGNTKEVQGLRRGKPFTYRLFVTNNKQIIYSNNVKPMDTTEVTLGADAAQTPTMVNLVPAESFNKLRTTGLVVGAIAGFAWAKYKKHDMKKVAMYIAIGAAVGYGGAYLVDRSRNATVKASK
jgi:hypothetical protein